MKKYILPVMVLLMVVTVSAQEDSLLYETSYDGEVISGQIPTEFIGNINGEVVFSNDVTFNGVGTYENGDLTIESGTINGLSITNGLYTSSGSIIVEDGTVNGIHIINGMKIESTSNGGFSGHSTTETTVNGIKILPVGTQFEYPSPSGEGITITASSLNLIELSDGRNRGEPQASRIEIEGIIIEIEAGKTVNIEPNGNIITTDARISHKSHSGHDHGTFYLNPKGSESTFSYTDDGHKIISSTGIFSFPDGFGRKLIFEGRDGFENSLFLEGSSLKAEGGWDFSIYSEDKYYLEGMSGFFLGDESFAGEIELKLDETLSIYGENILAKSHLHDDHSITGDDFKMDVHGENTINYVAPFSSEFIGPMESEEVSHTMSMATKKLSNSQTVLEVGNSDMNDIFSHSEGGHEDTHDESSTVVTGGSGHSEHSSTINVESGHGSGTIFGLGDETQNVQVFIREGQHERHASESLLNERVPEVLEDPSFELGIKATNKKLGGSFSYNPLIKQLGFAVEYDDKFTTNFNLQTFLGAGVGGHSGHAEGRDYRISLNYNPGCIGDWCFNFNTFYEGSFSGQQGVEERSNNFVASNDAHVSSIEGMNPIVSPEKNEENHEEHNDEVEHDD